MIRAVLLALVASLAIGAPIPKPSEREQITALWGKIGAPSDEYEFKLVGKNLTIRTIGAPTRGHPGNTPCTTPTISRTVTGDFEATVQIVACAAPNLKVKYDEGWLKMRAGLFIAGGENIIEWHLFQHHSVQNGVLNERGNQCVWVDCWFAGGGAGNHLCNADPTKPVYLRLARKDKVVTVGYSFDGKDWSIPYTPRRAMEFPDEVTVGIFLSHTSHQIADATFADFTVEKTKSWFGW